MSFRCNGASACWLLALVKGNPAGKQTARQPHHQCSDFERKTPIQIILLELRIKVSMVCLI